MAAVTLRQLIDRKGMKQRWIAEQLGVDSSLLSHWTSGVRLPTKHDTRQLAKLLNEPIKVVRLCFVRPIKVTDENVPESQAQ